MQYHPSYPTYSEVPDPYYGGARGFELVRQMIEQACEHLLLELQQRR